MLATLSPEVVTGPEWVFEEKYDGIRAIATRQAGAIRLWSRMLQDLTAGFPEIVAAVGALPDGDLAVDGELVSLDEHGVSRFQLLQRRGAKGATAPRYAVFDILELDGRSLRSRPLAERRTALEMLLARTTGPIFLSRRLPRDGEKADAIAREKGWEGIIAKDERSSYEANTRSRSWRKVKVRKESEFVIGGYTAPAGSREQFGALLVGLYQGRDLRFVGKVGTGYTRETLASLGARLARLRTPRCPFTPPPRIGGATWVRPKLVAQIAYAEWTAGDKLRQPAFLGLRTDKDPTECTWGSRET